MGNVEFPISYPSPDPTWATCCPFLTDLYEAKPNFLAHVFIYPKSPPCPTLCRGGGTFPQSPLHGQPTVRNSQMQCAPCRGGRLAELHFADLTRDTKGVANHGRERRREYGAEGPRVHGQTADGEKALAFSLFHLGGRVW